MKTERTPHFSLQLATLTVARLFINTGLRMVYPFIPALSRGLGVPIGSVYRLVAYRNFAGFLSPLFSPLSERYGRKPVIAVSSLLFGLSCLLVVVVPDYWFLGLTLSLIAVTKVIFDPAMQAYVGDTVPYNRRGRAIAVTELAWAGGLIVGAPAAGFLIARQGWQAPFLWLGLLGLVSAALLWWALPSSESGGRRGVGLVQMGQVIRRHPVIWAAAAYIMLAMSANETLFIIYGDWMEDSFNLSLTNLGLATGVIGGAEIVGELFVSVAVDRFGKRPVIITTGLLNTLLYLLIPFVSGTLAAALVTLFLLFLSFEITIVGGIPLLTEIVPSARGMVMSLVLAAASLGRASGAWLGPLIRTEQGFAGTGLTAALIMATAVFILALWVREGDTYFATESTEG